MQWSIYLLYSHVHILCILQAKSVVSMPTAKDTVAVVEALCMLRRSME